MIGIERVIEKGVVITKEWLDKKAPICQAWLDHWMVYPDLFE